MPIEGRTLGLLVVTGGRAVVCGRVVDAVVLAVAVVVDVDVVVEVDRLVGNATESKGFFISMKRIKDHLNRKTEEVFYLRLYGVGHMVKDHSDSERGNPLPPHGLLFLISSKGSFICIIPPTG